MRSINYSNYACDIVFNYMICLAMDFSSGLLRVWASVLNYILFKKCIHHGFITNAIRQIVHQTILHLYQWQLCRPYTFLVLSLLRYWIEGSSHAFCCIFWSIKSITWRQYTVYKKEIWTINITHSLHFLFIYLIFKIKMRSSF